LNNKLFPYWYRANDTLTKLVTDHFRIIISDKGVLSFFKSEDITDCVALRDRPAFNNKLEEFTKYVLMDIWKPEQPSSLPMPNPWDSLKCISTDVRKFEDISCRKLSDIFLEDFLNVKKEVNDVKPLFPNWPESNEVLKKIVSRMNPEVYFKNQPSDGYLAISISLINFKEDIFNSVPGLYLNTFVSLHDKFVEDLIDFIAGIETLRKIFPFASTNKSEFPKINSNIRNSMDFYEKYTGIKLQDIFLHKYLGVTDVCDDYRLNKTLSELLSNKHFAKYYFYHKKQENAKAKQECPCLFARGSSEYCYQKPVEKTEPESSCPCPNATSGCHRAIIQDHTTTKNTAPKPDPKTPKEVFASAITADKFIANLKEYMESPYRNDEVLIKKLKELKINTLGFCQRDIIYFSLGIADELLKINSKSPYYPDLFDTTSSIWKSISNNVCGCVPENIDKL